MTIRQLSVFLQNQPGMLRAVTTKLAEEKINLRALSVMESTDFGLLRLIVDKPDKAIKALEEANFVVKTNPVVAVEIPDRPGGLNDILGELASEAINIEYVYAFASSNEGKAMVLVRFDDNEKASAILEKQGVHVWNEEEIANL